MDLLCTSSNFILSKLKETTVTTLPDYLCRTYRGAWGNLMEITPCSLVLRLGSPMQRVPYGTSPTAYTPEIKLLLHLSPLSSGGCL